MNDKQHPKQDFLQCDHVKEQSKFMLPLNQSRKFISTLSISGKSIKLFKLFAHSIRLRS